jgi:hypothetical protein
MKKLIIGFVILACSLFFSKADAQAYVRVKIGFPAPPIPVLVAPPVPQVYEPTFDYAPQATYYRTEPIYRDNVRPYYSAQVHDRYHPGYYRERNYREFEHDRWRRHRW